MVEMGRVLEVLGLEEENEYEWSFSCGEAQRITPSPLPRSGVWASWYVNGCVLVLRMATAWGIFGDWRAAYLERFSWCYR